MADNENRPCSNVSAGVAIRDGQPVICVRAVQPLHAASQSTFCGNISEYNLSLQYPQLLRELQQCAVDVLEAHQFKPDNIRDFCAIVKDQIQGKSIPENYEPRWTESIGNFVEKLHEIADSRIRAASTVEVLEHLHLRLEEILFSCIKGKLNCGSIQRGRKFMLDVFRGKMQQSLQSKYFDEQFCAELCMLRDGLTKQNGKDLATSENQVVEKFLGNVVTSLSIKIWMNLKEMLLLLDNESEFSQLEIIIAVAGKTMEKRGSLKELPEIRELRDDVLSMPGVDGNLRRQLLDDAAASVRQEEPNETEKFVSELVTKIRYHVEVLSRIEEEDGEMESAHQFDTRL